MKSRILHTGIFLSFVALVSCNSGDKSGTDTNNTTNTTTTTPPADNSTKTTTTTGDEEKGVGKFTNVELTHPLDQKMVDAGKGVYQMKCASCHKTTEEKLVGPGWKGVTDRRKPEWIMNFVTNTDEMLEKNTEAKNLLEVCLVKMPNQNLSDDDARHVLEFMRNNDGQK
jgi:cytochrome c551/c552